MKSALLYILSIIVTTTVVLYLKFIFNNSSSSEGLSSTNMQINQIIKAEVEVLNGCGDSGIASLYSNYLIEEGFDVLEIKNAKNFDYLNTNIIVHNKDKINIAKNIAKKLNINHIKINENGIWDFSIIIGKDYRKLDSFNIVKQYYSPF
tara:strand:- start:175 stop:621 length:447 start_codon:yes stop_codon:yes gene_type:complete